MYVLNVLIALYILTFNFYNDPMKWVHLLSHFHRKGNWLRTGALDPIGLM